MRFLNLRHILHVVLEEHGRRNNQDRRIDEKGAVERDRRVDEVVFARLPQPFRRFGYIAALNQRRVQVEIVRHHRRAQDADRDVQHLRVCEDRSAGNEALGDTDRIWLGEEQFDDEARADGGDEQENERLHLADAEALDQQQKEYVKAGDDDGPDERNAVAAEQTQLRGEQVQADRGAEHFGQVAGGDRDFAQDEQHSANEGAV